MPNVAKLAKAELRQLDAKFKQTINKDKWTLVQFNPDTLKVSYANQIQQPPGSGDQNGAQAQQFVGAGSMKLAVQLVFDVTAEIPAGLPQVNDVRKLTKRITYFITPAGNPAGANPPKTYIPPAVRFLWGSFTFDGIVEGLEENLELFSSDGRPLRATLSLTLTQQKITAFDVPDLTDRAFLVPNRSGSASKGRSQGSQPGTAPLKEAPSGSNLQSLSLSLGGGPDWRAVASANGIENPRLLQPGQLIDMQVSVQRPTLE